MHNRRPTMAPCCVEYLQIPVLESLLDKCDSILLGGGMIFTFYRALGMSTGASMVEEDFIDMAKGLIEKAEAKGVKLLLPTDVVVADKFAADAATKQVRTERCLAYNRLAPRSNCCDDCVNHQMKPLSNVFLRRNCQSLYLAPTYSICPCQVAVTEIPDGWMGLDIGTDAVTEFKQEISQANTIVWNGPLGVFEWDAFANGTNELAKALAARTGEGGTTIVGGGDCVAAVEKAGVASQISHISTGGGASLELLEGKELPGIAALDDA